MLSVYCFEVFAFVSLPLLQNAHTPHQRLCPLATANGPVGARGGRRAQQDLVCAPVSGLGFGTDWPGMPVLGTSARPPAPSTPLANGTRRCLKLRVKKDSKNDFFN